MKSYLTLFFNLPLFGVLVCSTAFAWTPQSISIGKGEVKIFVNEEEPAHKCPNCVRFSFLVADKRAIPGTTSINEILLILNHKKAEAVGYFSGQVIRLTNLTPLYRNSGSAVISEQQAVSLPLDMSSKIEELEIRVIALKNRCMNLSDSSCTDRLIVAEKKLTGENIQVLEPIKPKELSKSE